MGKPHATQKTLTSFTTEKNGSRGPRRMIASSFRSTVSQGILNEIRRVARYIDADFFAGSVAQLQAPEQGI